MIRMRKRWDGMMSNILEFKPKPKPAHVDPWRHAQPSLRDFGDREELWSHPYFGLSLMIWATGSNSTPEPPTPTGGTPAANRASEWGQLSAVA